MTTYNLLSDLELVNLLILSDPKAFLEINRRYSKLLLSLTYRRIADIRISKELVFKAYNNLWDKRLTMKIPDNLQEKLVKDMLAIIITHIKTTPFTQKFVEGFREFLKLKGADYKPEPLNITKIIEEELAVIQKTCKN